jgi:signal transduction histidine kinase
MRRSNLFFTLSLLAGTLLSATASAQRHEALPAELSLPELEQRLSTIDAELAQLARITLRSGVGNVGWITNPQKNPKIPEWAEIALPENTLIDRIVLVPILWNDAEKGPQADGFPEAFEIIAGTADHPAGEVIARRGPADQFLPRVAPLVIDLPPTNASWVQVKATQLSSHARNPARVFKLSEIMLFSGEQNVALNQPVQVSSIVGGWGEAAIYKEALVDGLTPYLMDSAGETKSNPYMACSKIQVPFFFTIDLQKSYPIDGIRIHGADVNEYIPQINPTDFGMPRQLSAAGSNSPKFSAAVPLLSYRTESIYHVGNIMEWGVPKTDCRYVRFSVPPEAWPLDAGGKAYCISFAEIEILSTGQNVAKGKPAEFPKKLRFWQESPHLLTDGQNHFGTILTFRDWMAQLARRHDLETARPFVAEELNRRYSQQKENLRLMYWLASLLGAGVIILLLTQKVLRQRAVLKTRQRIAANLHDELGANLHAIGMLGDLAKADAAASERLTEIVTKIRALTERTGNAARACTHLLETDDPYDNLVDEMTQCSCRLLADIEHDLSFKNEELIQRLKPGKRTDLFLFYKECLTNILRHSGATRITTRLEADGKHTLQLVITDNGQGIEQTPPSLTRRARLLRAHLSVENLPEGGTKITLKLKPRKFGFKR